MNDRRPNRLWWLLAYAGLIIVCAVVLYPVLLVCKKAFEPGRHFALSPSPIPTAFTLDHFSDLFSARGGHGELLFLRHTINSVIVALATTVVGVVLSCTAAYALSRFRFPGRAAGLTSFLVVQMFPATLLLLPLYVILDKLGLLNSLVGLVLVYSTTAIPFCVWTLKGYFDTLPRELEEAARIDGASQWMIFRKIILPLTRPGIAVTASSVGQFSADWGLFAAGAIVTSLPVMIAFYVLQKYLVGGLTAGAVKG
jgi:arabinogalactan oligomer / maltooligosaccharide transport system permease protein